MHCVKLISKLKVDNENAMVPLLTQYTYQPAWVAQLDGHLTGDQELRAQAPPGWQHSLVKIDHEIFSTVILSHVPDCV